MTRPPVYVNHPILKRIHEVMTAKGYKKMRAFSRDAGLYDGHLEQLLSGRVNPENIAIATINKIAEFGGVTSEWILRGNEANRVCVESNYEKNRSKSRLYEFVGQLYIESGISLTDDERSYLLEKVGSGKVSFSSADEMFDYLELYRASKDRKTSIRRKPVSEPT